VKVLVCVVEGKGEVAAAPNLCARILRHLGAFDWRVDEDVIRQPRSKLVDERKLSPLRPCRTDGVERAIALAEKRRPGGVLLLCDADDDCPASWSASVSGAAACSAPVAAVMAVREYETWLLLNQQPAALVQANVPFPERIRDAKGALARIIPGYLPTTHQLEQTRKLDIPAVRARSRSFDKLVRAVAGLCGMPAPDKPAALP
jgi:hypothetical protein